MGTVYQRGNIWWIKYYRNGKSIRESAKTNKKTVATRLLERRENAIRSGRVPEIVFEKVSFDELAEDYLRDYRINKGKAFGRAKLSVNHLKYEFQGAKIPEITTPRIQKYVSHRMMWVCMACNKRFDVVDENNQRCPVCKSQDLKSGAANATINRELSALRRILNMGAKQTPPKVDRVPYIPMLKENNVRKGFFELADFLAFKDALDEHLQPFVSFGYRVGWRSREIINLTWSNVDLKNGIVVLEPGETKNNQGRTVYLDDELLTVFQDQWELRKQYKSLIPYVFPNATFTGPIVDFRRAWNRACRRVGLGYGYKYDKKYVLKWEGKFPPGPIFHDFRRTAVRNMVRAGVPERVAMMISGHKTRSVFDRYNIVNDADLKAAVKKHQAYLEEQKRYCSGHNMGTVSLFRPEESTANGR